MARRVGSHAEKTGPRVRQAALKLFAERGYAAVSMRQIGAEIGVQAGALYLYTPDKQTLLFDLLRDHMSARAAALMDLNLSGTPPDRLEAFCRFHIRHRIDHPDEARLADTEARNLDAENLAAIDALCETYNAVAEAILRDGKDDSSFRIADARVTARALLAMMTAANREFHEDGRLSSERLERIYWNLIRRSVGA